MAPQELAAARAGMFAGEVALITGAASGIGKACVDSFLARGASVVGLDINPAIVGLYDQAATWAFSATSPRKTR